MAVDRTRFAVAKIQSVWKHGFQILRGLLRIHLPRSFVKMLQHRFLAFGMDVRMFANRYLQLLGDALIFRGQVIELLVSFQNALAHRLTFGAIRGVERRNFGKLVIVQFEFGTNPREFRHLVEQGAFMTGGSD